MAKKRIRLDRDDVLTFLAGQRHASRVIQEQKRKRLLRMKPQESLSEYTALCEVWETNAPKKRIDALEKQRISFLIERRKKFDKAGCFEKTGKSSTQGGLGSP